MAMQAVLNEGGEGKLDIEHEVVNVVGQLTWLANALEANGNDPGADLILRNIIKQLDALVDPIAELQGVHHG